MAAQEASTGHVAVEVRLAAGVCTAGAFACLPVLKWWATAGWLRSVVAALSVLMAILAASFYRFMVRGDFKRCLAVSAAGALAGLVVWALFSLL